MYHSFVHTWYTTSIVLAALLLLYWLPLYWQSYCYLYWQYYCCTIGSLTVCTINSSPTVNTAVCLAVSLLYWLREQRGCQGCQSVAYV